MTNSIELNDFLNPFFSIFEETFESHHGIFLDAGTSLFQTLETISAEMASIPVGGRCATLAAQVAHITFYLEVLERYVMDHDTSPADWGKIWRTVEKVSPDEWQILLDQLKQVYERLSKRFHDKVSWNEDSIGDAIAIVVHSAYHLGEIRQALCLLA